jgi:hypothetical protein
VSEGGEQAAARAGEMWGWANWRAWQAGRPALGAVEYTLYTDTWVTGEVAAGLGPYQLLNTVPIPVRRGGAEPAVVLRVDHHLDPNPSSRDWTRNFDAYHGGGMADELAGLVSLALGVRLQGGGLVRIFDVEGGPRGRPMRLFYQSPYLAPTVAGRLPRIPNQILLDDCVLWLQRYSRLDRGQANALVRAARFYQAALWVAEADPREGWLKLISAVEVAADHWARKESNVEQLRAAEPELTDRLKDAGGGLLEAVADRFGPVVRSTNKLVNFTLEFLPPPPEPRPAMYALDWSPAQMRKHLRTIYGARSKDLHTGVAVPAPMCEAPMWASPSQPNAFGLGPATEDAAIYAERPPGLYTAVGTSVWQPRDAPMLLYTFEYIVRNALQKWWESMDSVAAVSGTARNAPSPPVPPVWRRWLSWRPWRGRFRILA